MSKEADNKAVVGRWFTDFWGRNVNLAVIDEIAAPDMLLKYSLHEPRRGREDIKAFMTDFRSAFPDLNFWGTAEAAAPIRGRPSMIFWLAASRPRPDARCASQAPRC
jgi:hypothetical protein